MTTGFKRFHSSRSTASWEDQAQNLGHLMELPEGEGTAEEETETRQVSARG